MAEAFTGIDSLGLFLSGGSSNYNPSDSLGGMISSKEVKGMSYIYSQSIQGLVIEDAVYENGEGEASIIIDPDDKAVYTPPDGQAGTGVAIAEGERKILTGDDTDKAIRIYRESGKVWSDKAAFELVNMLNGVIGMSDISNADRIAGSVIYRALFVKAFTDVEDVIAWITTSGQSSYSLAIEIPETDGSIQTISDEGTAPSGLAWIDAVSESSAIDLDDSTGLLEDETVGLWLKRIFPSSGIVAIKEDVDFLIQFTET